MTGEGWVALSPLLTLAVTVVLVMAVAAVRRHHGAALGITLAGLATAFAALWTAAPLTPLTVTGLLVVDRFALLYVGLIVAAAFVVAVLAYAYLERRQEQREEFYLLLLAATFGSAVLACSTHFVSLFLGLEILSISLYALIAYLRTSTRPLEAGIKYLTLAASSSAFLLFGMALVYAELGTMGLPEVAQQIDGGASGLTLAGLALMLVGVGFKLAAAPFHLWTPDVYEGAPVPVTAFIATVSKGGVFGLLLRFLEPSLPVGPLAAMVALLAIASMVAGNLLALLQDNVKRILAYSSIAHMGYLLVAFLASGETGAAAATFYLGAYFLSVLACFGVVTVLSGSEREADQLEDYRGLFWRHPVIASVFTAALLSLAGIPLTAGFMGKFYVAAAGASAARWALVLTLAVTSAVGLFYYLRIVVAMFTPVDEGAPEHRPVPWEGRAVLAALMLLLVVIGCYPGPLWDVIRTAVTGRA